MKLVAQLFLISIAVLILLGLQYQYWYGEHGHDAYLELLSQMDNQQQMNNQQIIDNRILRADVVDLKMGLSAVEEHARIDLGLIKPNETFVQISTAPTTYSTQVTPDSNPNDVIEEIPDEIPSDDL